MHFETHDLLSLQQNMTPLEVEECLYHMHIQYMAPLQGKHGCPTQNPVRTVDSGLDKYSTVQCGHIGRPSRTERIWSAQGWEERIK